MSNQTNEPGYEEFRDHKLLIIDPLAQQQSASSSSSSSSSSSPPLSASSPVVVKPKPTKKNSSSRGGAINNGKTHNNNKLSFDPYKVETVGETTNEAVMGGPDVDARLKVATKSSLLDDSDVELSTINNDNNTPTRMENSPTTIPGIIGYLEIEEDPTQTTTAPMMMAHNEYSMLGEEPITTSSGLLLTHRKAPSFPSTRQRASYIPETSGGTSAIPYFDKFTKQFRSISQNNEYRDAYYNKGHPFPYRGHSSTLLQAKRLLSYVRVWVVISFLFFLLATGVLIHSFHHDESTLENTDDNEPEVQLIAMTNVDGYATGGSTFEHERIILLPKHSIPHEQSAAAAIMQKMEQPAYELPLLGTHHHGDKTHGGHGGHGGHGVRRALSELRHEFESWVEHHGKKYHSENEKEHRFNIWSQNHQRTIEKNQRHGPCKMTNQHVFGSNQFKDLSPGEFKSRFLTGYKGPTTDKLLNHHLANPRGLSRGSGRVLDPETHPPNIHPSVHHRLLNRSPMGSSRSSSNCNWYDISCWLRWIFSSLGVSFGGTGTMEPAYDSDSYPTAVDWRDAGAVTDIRSQGECGACWAITAVETVESAHFLSTGNLYDLAETEIIICDDSCEMCSGGWPQNAFEWVMDKGGLPLQDSIAYDGDFLLAMTLVSEGTSSEYGQDTLEAYQEEICPAGGGNSHSGSGDNANNDSDQARYGGISGYGYATDRCVCYSDGTGCNCDTQNEALAVRNMATYGPAVVCLEASLWQDYTGGIITSELGCTSKFLDMNHCVQAVGYAFVEVDDDADNNGNDNDRSGSNSKSRSSGSQDSTTREGYWIIRNQWGNNWGMNGYAYVAMGENTCGVLNDMTQAYL